jgi:hypothetical protein
VAYAWCISCLFYLESDAVVGLHYPDQWLGRNGPVLWPPWSPALILPYPCSHQEVIVYSKRVNMRDDLWRLSERPRFLSVLGILEVTELSKASISTKKKDRPQVQPITCHVGTERRNRFRSTLFLTLELVGLAGKRHAPAALFPGITPYRLYRRLGGTQGRSGRVRKISLPLEFDPWTVQSTETATTLSQNIYTENILGKFLKALLILRSYISLKSNNYVE